MTAKQERFVQAYLVNPDATNAAREAGYSDKTASQIGYQLLHNPSVARAIESGQKEHAEKVGITVDYVLALHRETAERCLQRVPVMEFDYESRSMVQKRDAAGNGVWEFDSSGVNKAAELMGKHLGMYKEVTEHKVGALDELRRILRGD